MKKRKKNKWREKNKYIAYASIFFISTYANAGSLGGFDIEIGEGTQNGSLPEWDSMGTEMEGIWDQEPETEIYEEFSGQQFDVIEREDSFFPPPGAAWETSGAVPENIQEGPVPAPEIIQEIPMPTPEIIQEILMPTAQAVVEMMEPTPLAAEVPEPALQTDVETPELTPKEVCEISEAVISQAAYPSVAAGETPAELFVGQEIFYFSSTVPEEGKLRLEIKTEEPVYILSFRIGQKERLWHWEEGRIATEARKGEKGEKAELLIICENKDKIQVFIDDTSI